MKVTITYLKAPWPRGAQPGDVVEFDSIPAWAVGKCRPAPEDAEVYAPPPDEEAAAVVSPGADAEEEARIAAALAEADAQAAQESAALQAKGKKKA